MGRTSKGAPVNTRPRKSQLSVDSGRSARMAVSMRAARLLHDASQEAIAEKIGVDLKTIQRIESGRQHNPNLATLHALADLYGLPMDVVTGRREPAPAPEPATVAIGELRDRLEAYQQRQEAQFAELAGLIGATNLSLERTNGLIAAIANALHDAAPRRPNAKPGHKAS